MIFLTNHSVDAASSTRWGVFGQSRKSFYSIILLAILLVAPIAHAQYDLILDIGNSEGIANGPATVGIELTALTHASTLQFQVQYDSSKLDFQTVYPGQAATQAGKVVSASVSIVAPGTVNVVVSGSGTSGVQTLIADGEVALLAFKVASTVSAGSIIPVTGGAVTASTPAAVSIPSGMTDGQVTVVTCKIPTQPSAVTATNGAFADRVRISWEPSLLANKYIIFRAAQNSLAAASAIDTVEWTLTYDDVIGAVNASNDTGGCGGAGAADLSGATFYYWVVAWNRCGQSGFGNPDAGNVAASKSKSVKRVHPEVLPADRNASPGDPLALRVYGVPADTDGVVVTVDGSKAKACTYDVLPASDKTGDVWVVCRPDSAWPSGGLVHVKVRVKGEGAAACEAVFHINSGAEPHVPGPRVSILDTPGGTSLKTALLGTAFCIEPCAPFSEPQWIWLPVPPSLTAENAVPYYLYDSEWQHGNTVDGWLAEPSFRTMEEGSQVYLGFKVRHGGVVRLGEGARKAEPAVASLCPGENTSGGLALLALAVGALASMHYLRRA